MSIVAALHQGTLKRGRAFDEVIDLVDDPDNPRTVYRRIESEEKENKKLREEKETKQLREEKEKQKSEAIHDGIYAANATVCLSLRMRTCSAYSARIILRSGMNFATSFLPWSGIIIKYGKIAFQTISADSMLGIRT